MSENDNTNGYHEFVLELINLREADYDKFLDKLYEGMTGQFAGAIEADPTNQNAGAKLQALKRMIKHFEQKEEYEKCAKIKTIIDVLERSAVTVK